MTFAEYQLQEHGYECCTTFYEDFRIADIFGIDAVRDTFNRAFNEWKNDYKYLTELCIVMNHLCWFHYNNNNFELSELYADYYHKVRDYALDNLKGEEFKYFYEITD